eukprot:2995213-Rhodomonas_salina.1
MTPFILEEARNDRNSPMFFASCPPPSLRLRPQDVTSTASPSPVRGYQGPVQDSAGPVQDSWGADRDVQGADRDVQGAERDLVEVEFVEHGGADVAGDVAEGDAAEVRVQKLQDLRFREKTRVNSRVEKLERLDFWLVRQDRMLRE